MRLKKNLYSSEKDPVKLYLNGSLIVWLLYSCVEWRIISWQNHQISDIFKRNGSDTNFTVCLSIKLRTHALKVDVCAKASKLMAYLRLYILCTNKFPKSGSHNRFIRCIS